MGADVTHPMPERGGRMPSTAALIGCQASLYNTFDFPMTPTYIYASLLLLLALVLYT